MRETLSCVFRAQSQWFCQIQYPVVLFDFPNRLSCVCRLSYCLAYVSGICLVIKTHVNVYTFFISNRRLLLT